MISSYKARKHIAYTNVGYCIEYTTRGPHTDQWAGGQGGGGGGMGVKGVGGSG